MNWQLFVTLAVIGASATGWLTLRARLQSATQDLRSAQAASQSDVDALANISHEIRTPMAGIVGLVDMLLETELDDDQREMVESLALVGAGLVRLADDLLDVSRLEAGKVSVEEARFEIRPLLEKLLVASLPAAEAKGLSLHLDVNASVPSAIRGDALRLRQVVTNLVNNAIKFTDSGGVRVSVTRKGGVLAFDVIDTGVGISDEAARRLFHRYERGDPSTARVHGGSGLGLAISRDIVSLLGGEIGVESAPGGGSRFWFTLPLVIARPDGGAQKTAVVREGHGERLLVVEDNAVNQKVVVAMLKSLGYASDVVTDGDEAVSAVRDGEYAAVLMDCLLPRVDGYRATAIIRESEQDSHIPIIAMSAASSPSDRKRCLAVGMDAFVPKPIDKAVLAETLDRFVGVHHQVISETN